MSRFVAFEDNTLDQRLQRLRRSELNLQARLHAQAAEARRAGHYVAADPDYRRLAAILRSVRRDLQDTTQEQLRRATAAKLQPASRAERPRLPQAGRTSERLGPKVMSSHRRKRGSPTLARY
jgi:hypothetical protein